MIYEGGYNNNKFHGKGKLYNGQKLKYEEKFDHGIPKTKMTRQNVKEIKRMHKWHIKDKIFEKFHGRGCCYSFYYSDSKLCYKKTTNMEKWFYYYPDKKR